MLVEDDPPDEIRRQFSTAIRNNTLRLQRLVDDLLDLSRLESGGWAAGTEPVDIRDAVEEAWELVAPQAKPELEFTVEGDGVALGDRQGLVQVFRNLLENAVRHTDDGGRVRVRIAAKDAGRLVQVEVTDDGEGIPARALPRIFERFYRADSSRARDFGGTGLGLAIVKHLVGAMAGDVRVVSELGRGTTFTVTLPTERQRDAS
jgi:signal transduction histidine kinase